MSLSVSIIYLKENEKKGGSYNLYEKNYGNFKS